MKKKIGETHFYCGFCNKLFSKEELDAVTGRHTLYEISMIKLGKDLGNEFKKIFAEAKERYNISS